MNDQISASTKPQHVESRIAEANSCFRRRNRGLLASAGFAAFLLASAPALAVAVAPPLGTAASYTILGTNATPTVATVTCVDSGPGTAINGDVGSTFNSITPGACTINGAIVAPVAAQVVTDFNNAYSALDTLNPTCDAAIPLVDSTLAPGVYCSAAGTTLGAVTFTLNGTASNIWVFKVGTGGTGALTGTGFQMVMGGTAQPYNVYWWTKQAATLTDSTFKGTILSGAAITTTRANWVGRAMATTDVSVTNAMPMTFAGAPLPPTLGKAFGPATINAGGVSTLTITLSNPDAAIATLSAALTDTLPGGVVVAPAPAAATTCGGGAARSPAMSAPPSSSVGSPVQPRSPTPPPAFTPTC